MVDSVIAKPGAILDDVTGSVSSFAAEECLVRAAAAGDAAAFLSIWDRYAGSILAYARRRLGGLDEAEDVVQEVFMALVKHGANYRGRAPIHAFLYRVAHNRVSNRWRDRRPQTELGDQARPAPAYADINAVRTALTRLAPRFREPIMLLMWDGLTYEEIGAVLEIPIGTVRSRIARGKARLARCLAPVRSLS